MGFKKKRVSIIIPAYNVKRHIEKCLASACGQTYENIQIIVVDDGSNDGTAEIARKFAERDNRILLFSKDNGGVSSARNAGLKYADGEFISFLDADDILEPDSIEVSVNAIESSGADLVSFQYSRIDEDGNCLKNFDFIDGTFSFKNDNDRLSFIVKELLSYNIGVEVWNKLFKRVIIVENNLLFDEECSVGEDYAFNIKYLIHSSKIICLPDRLYIYKNRDGSAMNLEKSFEQNISDRVLMLKDVCSYIKESGNQYFYREFPLVFIEAMNSQYIGYTATEVADQIQRIRDLSFAKTIYNRIPEVKKDFLDIDKSDIARIKYRYNLYIKGKLDGFSLKESIALLLYNFYRKLRGRESLEFWIMPY